MMDNDNTLQAQPKTRKKNAVVKLFEKFCASTSLHGFQYIGDNSVPVLERICWAIAICLGVFTCSYLINNVYQKWVSTPVIVSFAKTSTKVTDIPFPAVTICNGNKVQKSIFNYGEAFKKTNQTEEEKKQIEYISLLCEISEDPNLDKIVDQEVITFLKEVSTPINEMLLFCAWRNIEIDCDEIFSPLMTNAGLCYTFNMANAKELFTKNVDPNQYLDELNHNNSLLWSMERGYVSQSKDAFPRRSLSSGFQEGLVVLYKQNLSNLCDVCGFPAFGFEVLVHSPVDFPDINNQYFRVPEENDVVVGIQANMITTSRGLERNLKPPERKCFMSYERNLHFFNIYSEANCELECFINATLKECNCSAFFMPRDPNTNICGSGSWTCIDKVLGNLHLDNEIDECNCFPSCTQINYNIETSQSKVRWSESLILEKDKEFSIGRLQLYFKSNRFVTRRRSQLYGVSDFIANCGGLLGLFLGFSFLSLVEVFYFFLLQPLVMIVNYWYKRQYSPAQTQPNTYELTSNET